MAGVTLEGDYSLKKVDAYYEIERSDGEVLGVVQDASSNGAKVLLQDRKAGWDSQKWEKHDNTDDDGLFKDTFMLLNANTVDFTYNKMYLTAVAKDKISIEGNSVSVL